MVVEEESDTEKSRIAKAGREQGNIMENPKTRKKDSEGEDDECRQNSSQSPGEHLWYRLM